MPFSKAKKVTNNSSISGQPSYPRQPLPAYPVQQTFGVAPAQPPPPYSSLPSQSQYYPSQPSAQPWVAAGSFDAGARFDGVAQQTIPPPPPGCMPIAAQMAAMSGQQVNMTQNKSNLFSGGSNGGIGL